MYVSVGSNEHLRSDIRSMVQYTTQISFSLDELSQNSYGGRLMENRRMHVNAKYNEIDGETQRSNNIIIIHPETNIN